MRSRTRYAKSDPIILQGSRVSSSGNVISSHTKKITLPISFETIEDHTSRASKSGRPDQPMRLGRNTVSSSPSSYSLRITPNSNANTFQIINDSIVVDPIFTNFPTSGVPTKYVGDLTSPPTWDSSSQSYDPLAYKRMRPDKAVTELAVTLIELRDLKKSLLQLESLWKEVKDVLDSSPLRKKTVKEVLGSHLAVEFGLLPLVDDTRKVLSSFSKFKQFVDRYATSTGSPVMKRSWATILDEKGSDSISHGLTVSSSGLVTSLGPSVVTSYKTADTYVSRSWGDNVWAQADWKVYLKRPTTSLEYANLYRRFLGLRIGLDTIWELIPFSFMADYVSSVGDSLANLSPGAADETVIVKGVSMRHRYLHIDATYQTYRTGGTFYSLKREYVTCSTSAKIVYETKSRRLLDPYGAFIRLPDLNVRQIATLSSLGLLTALGKVS